MVNLETAMKITLSEEFQAQIESIVEESFNRVFSIKESRIITENEWMTQTEASKWARVSPTTLLKWRREGLKIATIEGKTLVSKSEINRFLKSREF